MANFLQIVKLKSLGNHLVANRIFINIENQRYYAVTIFDQTTQIDKLLYYIYYIYIFRLFQCKYFLLQNTRVYSRKVRTMFVNRF